MASTAKSGWRCVVLNSQLLLHCTRLTGRPCTQVKCCTFLTEHSSSSCTGEYACKSNHGTNLPNVAVMIVYSRHGDVPDPSFRFCKTHYCAYIPNLRPRHLVVKTPDCFGWYAMWLSHLRIHDNPNIKKVSIVFANL